MPKNIIVSTSLLTENECVMNVKISFNCLPSRLKTNGLVPIYCTLKKGNDVIRFSTKLAIPIMWWDAKRCRVKGKTQDALMINEQLDKIIQKLKHHQLSLINQKGELTIPDLMEEFQERKVKHPTSLMATYKHKFERMNKLLDKDYTRSTLSKYSQMAKAVLDFLRTDYKTNDIQLTRLNRPFLDDLEVYLRTVRNMKPISSNKVIQHLKSVVIYALEREWIDKDPFVGHIFKRVETEIKYLTKEQINILETTTIYQPRLEQVKQLFLFSIYTGLHYSDAMSLTKSNIISGNDSKLWIDYVRGKTGKRIQIPLLSKAQQLLNGFEEKKKLNGYLLPRISNQKLNSYLKEISEILNIEVTLTHKIARKTFGSILLFYNVPIKVVSELMGHSSTLITERHYAKLDTRKLGEAMQMLEEFRPY